MNIKKIIKSIVRLGVITGIVYLAYKIGESNGKINEHFRNKYRFKDAKHSILDGLYYDEPDDGCIAPANKYKDNEIPFGLLYTE